MRALFSFALSGAAFHKVRKWVGVRGAHISKESELRRNIIDDVFNAR